MFDPDTSRLIQNAQPLDGLDLERLPDLLTDAYAKVIAARLGAVSLAGENRDPEWTQTILELRRLAETYEALALFLPDTHEQKTACAFVAASAHHTLSQARVIEERASGLERRRDSLSTHGVSPEAAACLLFLISGHQADAAEASKLFRTATDDQAKQSLLNGIAGLASGDGQEVLRIATSREPLPTLVDLDYVDRAADAIWRRLNGAVRMTARNAIGMDLEHEPTAIVEAVLQDLERSTRNVAVVDLEFTVRAHMSGPYHLARLLLGVSSTLLRSSVTRLPPPRGVDADGWLTFCLKFARRRPFLWRNHIAAFEQRFLEPGASSVVTFPTGAGKTTLTELRIAAEVLRGRRVIYLAPTRALVDQVSRELTLTLAAIGSAVVRGRLLEDYGEKAHSDVIVQTPEQCLAYLAFDPAAHNDIGLIVVDECHQLSGGQARTDGNVPVPSRRSVDAMWAILSLLRRAPLSDIVLLSAMVRNGEALAAWLRKATGRPVLLFDLLWKPTRQVRGVVVYESHEIRTLQMTLRQRKGAPGSKAKPRAADRRGLVATPVGLFCHTQVWSKRSSFAKFRVLSAPHPLTVNDFWGLTANRNAVGAQLLAAMAGSKMRPIVFTQQIGWTQAIAGGAAAELARNEVPEIQPSTQEQRLLDAAAKELGGTAYVEFACGGRVGVHHGLLLLPERLAVESAFRRENGLYGLVATPTVAQGINLPAEAVVIAGDDRWSHESERGGMEPLAAHELLNAAGRAGRAGHYAHGIVVDVPGKVLTVETAESGMHSVAGLEHIMGLLGMPDQCLDIVDPITQLMDRIQKVGVDNDVSEYLVRRAAGLSEDGLVGVLASAFGNATAGRSQERALQQATLIQAMAAKLEIEEQGESPLDVERWRDLAGQLAVPAVSLATIASHVPDAATVKGWSILDARAFVQDELFAQLFLLVDPDASGFERILPQRNARKTKRGRSEAKLRMNGAHVVRLR